MKRLSGSGIIGLFFLLISLSGADYTLKPSDRELNSVLASVNGEPVCLSDVLPFTRSLEYQAYAAYSGKELETKIRELRKNAVDELINRKLVLADFHAKQYALASADVEFELDKISDRMGCRSRDEFRRRLRAEGTDEETVRKDVENNLSCQMMLFRENHNRNFVTPQDVYMYYEKNRAEFSEPETVELAMLRLAPETPELEKAVAEITAGLRKDPAAFAVFLQKYAPGSGDGSLGVVECAKLRPEFAAAVGSAAIGTVCGPVRVPDGTVFLKVLARRKAKTSDFAGIEPEIRKKLEAQQRKIILKEYTDRLRKDAVIRYYF